MSEIRSRRAGIDPVAARARPLYARALGLQFIQPSNLMCFLFFEGTVALGVLLALAELADWWAVAILPLSVAIMVKVNDAVAGAAARSGTGSRGSAVAAGRDSAAGRSARKVSGRVSVPVDSVLPPPPPPPAIEQPDAFAEQRSRQAATRRYE
jgi:hypothetical protein